jgi:hypothetical protein
VDEDMKPEYEFLFVGGSCGSFVKFVFYYYLQMSRNQEIPWLDINSETGDAHSSDVWTVLRHYHRVEQLNPALKLVLVDFDDDDKETIVRMGYHKAMKPLIIKNPTLLTVNFSNIVGSEVFANVQATDFDKLEAIFIQHPQLLIFPNWREQIQDLEPVLTVKFKDIMFGNLNKIIADFFNTTPLLELNHLIQEYRDVNKKYLSSVA